MRTGLLRKKITIQSYTESQNSYGEPVKSWSNFAANRWAEVKPSVGTEAYQGNQILAEDIIVFAIRYISGVLPQMRVVFNSQNYDIKSVVNADYKNRWLELHCTKASA